MAQPFDERELDPERRRVLRLAAAAVALPLLPVFILRIRLNPSSSMMAPG